MTTGGFGANLQMVGQYRPDFMDFNTSNHYGASGDAFEWVSSLDVPLVHMDQIQIHPTCRSDASCSSAHHPRFKTAS